MPVQAHSGYLWVNHGALWVGVGRASLNLVWLNLLIQHRFQVGVSKRKTGFSMRKAIVGLVQRKLYTHGSSSPTSTLCGPAKVFLPAHNTI